MTINPNGAEYGFPYLVEYKDEKWTGVRHRQTVTSMNPDADLVIDTADTTSWIFLAQGDAGEVIAEQHPHAKGEDFGKIVPLVPARPITRDDLPSVTQAQDASIRAGGIIPSVLAVSEILDAVVAHLNANGGIPAENPRKPDYVLNNGKCCEEAALNAAEVDRLASERDTLQRCVDSWAARGEKAEDDAKWYRDLALKADATIEEAEHERDEWKDRAEMADEDRTDVLRENDKLHVKLDAAGAEVDRLTRERDEALKSREYLRRQMSKQYFRYSDLVRERDELQAKLNAAAAAQLVAALEGVEE